MNDEQADWFAETFEKLAANIERAIIGKPQVVRLALTCLLSDGHLLLEDVPGTGKTMLAKSIANTVQGSHGRIQFTPDLLPSDITPTWTNVTTNGNGDADVLTVCYAGNASVGFEVEGVGSWGQYQVRYAR